MIATQNQWGNSIQQRRDPVSTELCSHFAGEYSDTADLIKFMNPLSLSKGW